METYFQSINSIDDVYDNITMLYNIFDWDEDSEYEKFIKGVKKELPKKAYVIEDRTDHVTGRFYERDDVSNLSKAAELFRFIRDFVENKAGNITPKSMVIQHRILESMLSKCGKPYTALQAYINLSYFMNVQHRLKIEENLKLLPF